MRRSLITGTVLAVAAGIVVLVSSALDLGLESAALLGGALGAVVALVPDRTAGVRLGGFAIGFVAAWVGYLLRAGMLPDSAGGRAAAVMGVVLVCVAVTAASGGRLPLWTLLLGTAAFAGGYEFTFDQAPPEVVSTSFATATTLLLDLAIGFFAGSLLPVAASNDTDAVEPELAEVAR